MLTIEYSSEGIAVADLKVEEVASKLIRNKRVHYHTSTDSLITAFRLLVAEGVISKDDVQFKFGDEIITMDSYGQTNEVQIGFADSELNRLHRLLNVQINEARKIE